MSTFPRDRWCIRCHTVRRFERADDGSWRCICAADAIPGMARELDRASGVVPAGGTFKVWTDGACRLGDGGWAVVVVDVDGETIQERSGHGGATTNNRMELRAAIEGLRLLPTGSRVRVYSDSQYVINGAARWMAAWKRGGWFTAAKQPVKNRDLWEPLDALAQRHQVEWRWVRSHSGAVYNERCDALATAACLAPDRPLSPSPSTPTTAPVYPRSWPSRRRRRFVRRESANG